LEANIQAEIASVREKALEFVAMNCLKCAQQRLDVGGATAASRARERRGLVFSAPRFISLQHHIQKSPGVNPKDAEECLTGRNAGGV
jgi:hypothetical protein